MKKNFWTQVNKPLFVLAPMADVTDVAFRTIINKYGKPELQHEFIWENYVKEIAIGTETIHKLFPENYNRFHDYMDGTTGYTKDSFYESVAKAGLTNTSYFKNLDITKQNTHLLLYGSLKANGKRLTDYKNCN